MLLPLSRASSMDLSLVVHLALAACRGTEGNAHVMNELVRVVYLSYFLAQKNRHEPAVLLYLRAEAFLERHWREPRRNRIGNSRLKPPACWKRLLPFLMHNWAVCQTGPFSTQQISWTGTR